MSEVRQPTAVKRVLTSIVIPIFFNEENIPVTWAALENALEELPDDCAWEVVFVEDGSGDRSFAKLTELFEATRDRVRIVKLTRNFGQPAAVLAGLREARGDCCVIMSADLQDPPELIPEMIRRWSYGEKKIVIATRAKREDSLIARWTSRIFYTLIRRFAVPNMPEGGFDFVLLDRRVVDLINKMDERNPFVQGQILWTGFTPVLIPYTRRKREIGRSRWTLAKKITYLIDGFVTFTVAPIRGIALLGLMVSLLSFSYAMVIFIAKTFWDVPVKGWAPTMIAILILGGLQLVMLGIIGEYLWRNYHESRRRPNFVVETILRARDNDARNRALTSRRKSR